MHATKRLPSFDLSYCFGDVVFLLGMGLNALLMSCRNCNGGIREAGSSYVMIIFYLRCGQNVRHRAVEPLMHLDCPLAAEVGAPSYRPA